MTHERRYSGVGHLGLARWPFGRFAGLTVAKGGGSGSLVTHPFKLEGVALELNLRQGDATVSCVVEVLAAHPQGKVQQGRQRAWDFLLRSKVIWGVDSTAALVSWEGRRKLSSLRSRLVRLRFHLNGSTGLIALFGFQVTR